MRYCTRELPNYVCYLKGFRHGDFGEAAELEACAIHMGADHVVAQAVGHENACGTPAWIVIWDASPSQGRRGRSNARLF